MNEQQQTWPAFCYIVSPYSGKPMMIKRNQMGYWYGPKGIDVDKENKKLGITKGMVKAMEVGARLGWGRSDADPSYWNDDGTPKKKS